MFLSAIRILLMKGWTAAALLSPGPAVAGEVLAGPYAAAVERVVDGDTLAVRVTIWLGQEVGVLVRLRGVDAPERRGRCDSEKARAAEASEALRRLVEGGAVVLSDIEGDKYFGRVVADVAAEGADVGAALLAGGFARVYEGGARAGWCGEGDEVVGLRRGD